MARFLALSGAPDDLDAGAEAETIFAGIERASARFSDLARIRFFYSAFDQVAQLTAVRHDAFPSRFPDADYSSATGVITGGRPGGPRLEAQVVVVPDPAATRRRIQPTSLWSTVGGQELPVSHGIAIDGVLFVSGQVPYDRDARLVGEDSPTQIDQALANLEAVLAEAGARREDVLGITVYHVVDSADHDARAREHFDQRVAHWSPVPAPVAWVGVRELFQPGLAIEIEATASLTGAVRRSGCHTAAGRNPGSAFSASADWAYATVTARWDDALTATVTACDGLAARLPELSGDISAMITLWCPEPEAIEIVDATAHHYLSGAVITVVPQTTPMDAEAILVLEAISRRPG